jgi:hypothetical protein
MYTNTKIHNKSKQIWAGIVDRIVFWVAGGERKDWRPPVGFTAFILAPCRHRQNIKNDLGLDLATSVPTLSPTTCIYFSTLSSIGICMGA